MDLDSLKALKRVQIKNEYKKELNGLANYDIGDGVVISLVDGDSEKRKKENALEYIKRKGLTEGRCVTYSGVVMLQVSQWEKLLEVISDTGAYLFGKNLALLEAIDSATLETIDGINW